MENQPITNTEATSEVTTPQEERIHFTPAQQSKIDSLIREAMGRSARDVRQKLAEREAELQALKSNTAPPPADTAHEDVIESLHGETKELRGQVSALSKALADQRLESGLLEQLRDVGFIDTRQGLQLIRSHFRTDESGETVVVDSSGKPVDMSPSEFIAQFSQQNIHLLKASAYYRGGTGSTPAQKSALSGGRYTTSDIFGPKSNAALANKLARTDIKAYRALRQKAIEEGLIS